jgi:hypothetical protein
MPIPRSQTALFLGPEPEGDGVPTDMDLGMVVPTLGLPGDPPHPPHRLLEIREAFLAHQPTPSPLPCCSRAESGGGFRVHRLRQPNRSGRRLKVARGKFLPIVWGQPSNRCREDPQQPPGLGSAWVVPRTIHRPGCRHLAIDAGFPDGCPGCSRRLLRTFSLKILHQ